LTTGKEIKVRVKHSTSISAWNIEGVKLGGKHKIAIVPYVSVDDALVTNINKSEALKHAEYIALCFNNSNNTILN